MVYVYKVLDEEKDELISVCDRQFLYNFLQEHCQLNDIKFETQLTPSNDGKYLIYRGENKDVYEIIETIKGVRKILYTLLIC